MVSQGLLMGRNRNWRAVVTHHPSFEEVRIKGCNYRSSRSPAHVLWLSLGLALWVMNPVWLTDVHARDFESVAFVSPDTGWVMSTSDVLHTTDGGQSWTMQLNYRGSDTESRVPQQLQVMDAQHVWVLYDQSRLLLTQDGGRNWQVVEVEPTVQLENLTSKADLDRFLMLTPERGYGLSFDGTAFLRTIDGGKTWRTRLIRMDPPGFAAMDFLNLQHGWLVGPLGLLAQTSDGGQTWQPLPKSPATAVLKLQFRSLDSGWLLEAGPRRLFRTTDGGQTWQQCAPGQPTPQIYGVHFRTPTLGWATAGAGIIIKTTDGCATWQTIQTPVTNLLVSIFFLDDLNGWVVGDNNTVLKTADGGLTWTPVPVKVP